MPRVGAIVENSSTKAALEIVAVVNETFVQQNFPDQEVLGARVRVTASFGYGSPYWTVVGVVKDVRRYDR